jgi:adenine-specific DNA-methyltransferase
VSQKYAKDAVREAIQAGDIDLLCVLGFAFDPDQRAAPKLTESR